MANYHAPGVYIEEISGTRPIEGVATAVAGFVGVAPTGPTDTAVQITSWREFVTTFGVEQQVGRGQIAHNPYVEGYFLAHAVAGFFTNGGSRAFVVNVASPRGTDADEAAPEPLPALGSASVGGLLVTATDPRAGGLAIEVTAPEEDAEDGAFGLRLMRGDEVVEDYGDVRLGTGDAALEDAGLSDAVTAVNESSELVRVELTGSTAPMPGTYELTSSSVAPATPAPVTGGAIGGDVDPSAFLGDSAQRSGSFALAAVDEVTMVCIPDLVAGNGAWDSAQVQAVQRDLVAACADLGDRMAILDPPRNHDAQQIAEWRSQAGFDLPFGALYWPWVAVADPSAASGTVWVPPSGHLAGVWARVDAERGVHKAPANEQVRGVVTLERQTTRAEQAGLNPEGINCIRQFPGSGIRVWGARTLANSDPAFKYLNVRRLFNYLEESILEGTQWVVFEPNDENLWAKLRRTVGAFLLSEWRSGALFGATPDEAFFVICDATTNPDVSGGEVICEVGVAPVRPAEFVVFRVRQLDTGVSAVAE